MVRKSTNKNKQKSCLWKNACRNGNDGCWTSEPEKCIRFMPLKGTNLTKINGVIETPPGIDDDKLCQYFTNWIESMGWSYCGSIRPYDDKDKKF